MINVNFGQVLEDLRADSDKIRDLYTVSKPGLPFTYQLGTAGPQYRVDSPTSPGFFAQPGFGILLTPLDVQGFVEDVIAGIRAKGVPRDEVPDQGLLESRSDVIVFSEGGDYSADTETGGFPLGRVQFIYNVVYADAVDEPVLVEGGVVVPSGLDVQHVYYDRDANQMVTRPVLSYALVHASIRYDISYRFSDYTWLGAGYTPSREWEPTNVGFGLSQIDVRFAYSGTEGVVYVGSEFSVVVLRTSFPSPN